MKLYEETTVISNENMQHHPPAILPPREVESINECKSSEKEIVSHTSNSNNKPIAIGTLMPNQSTNRYTLHGIPLIPKPAFPFSANKDSCHLRGNASAQRELMLRNRQRPSSIPPVPAYPPLRPRYAPKFTSPSAMQTTNIKPENNQTDDAWREYWDEEVEASYYYNVLTGEANWVHPNKPK